MGTRPPAAMTTRATQVDFHGEKRSNATHQSTTDLEARLFRKGQGGKAGVHGPRFDRKPQRDVDGLPGDLGHGDSGAGCGAGYGRPG